MQQVISNIINKGVFQRKIPNTSHNLKWKFSNKNVDYDADTLTKSCLSQV